MLFDRLDDLKQRLDAYAVPRGFKVRRDNHDDKRNGVIKSAFVCWCYQPPQQNPDGTLRTVHYKDAGRDNCKCTWWVRYRKNASDSQFHITAITEEHTGHEVVELPSPSRSAAAAGEAHPVERNLRAREDVSEEMVDKMRELAAMTFSRMSTRLCCFHEIDRR
jgi:hypothetical protein